MNDVHTLPALLVIMDGLGIEAPGPGNAVACAAAPFLDSIGVTHPRTRLVACGEAVGLPEGQMGNSEVGHLNIGAGRVVYQELTRINKACREGQLSSNDTIGAAFDAAARPGAALHLMGLLSDGGVHSSNEHLYALIRAALAHPVSDIRIHCFMDGRDVPPASGKGYIEELENFISEVDGQGRVRIVSVSGRYYAMDRDKRWERVQRAWDAVVAATPLVQDGAAAVMQASYDAGVTDEFVEPVALDARGVREGDAVLFFNFRPDRARQLTYAFVDQDFEGFERTKRPQVSFVCLTEYDAALDVPVAFAKEFPQNVLADVLAQKGLRQYHIAETEKYAHVTFFLNGGKEEPKEGEQRRLIPSPKVATYDLKPEMSAFQVTEALVEAIRCDAADVYIVNFANCDMVGHTGSIPAATAAVEATDAGVRAVVEAICEKGGFALVTADHGNADKMIADDGGAHTAHTLAPVPFVLVDGSGTGLCLVEGTGALCDIAPTLLSAIGVDIPSEMTGTSLLA